MCKLYEEIPWDCSSTLRSGIVPLSMPPISGPGSSSFSPLFKPKKRFIVDFKSLFKNMPRSSPRMFMFTFQLFEPCGSNFGACHMKQVRKVPSKVRKFKTQVHKLDAYLLILPILTRSVLADYFKKQEKNYKMTKNEVVNVVYIFILTQLHCYHQGKIRWLERDLNSHLRVSRPPLYPLSYRINGDWWRVLFNLSGRNIFATGFNNNLDIRSFNANIYL